MPMARSQVLTVERFTGSIRSVGYALLPVFLDPKEGGQPVSRWVRQGEHAPQACPGLRHVCMLLR